MPIIEISSLSHPGIEVFSTLTEAQLRNRIEPDKGLFIAESPKVMRVALDAGYEPLALLCEQKHITGDAADIISRCGDVPVYTGGRELLANADGLCPDARSVVRHASPRAPHGGRHMSGCPAHRRHRRCGGHYEHWCHFSFGGRSRDGCRVADA